MEEMPPVWTRPRPFNLKGNDWKFYLQTTPTSDPEDGWRDKPDSNQTLHHHVNGSNEWTTHRPRPSDQRRLPRQQQTIQVRYKWLRRVCLQRLQPGDRCDHCFTVSNVKRQSHCWAPRRQLAHQYNWHINTTGTSIQIICVTTYV